MGARPPSTAGGRVLGSTQPRPPARFSSLRSHDCRADLTKPDPMAPSRPMKGEPRGNALRPLLGPDDEGAAVQMRGGEPTPDLQFLPDYDDPPGANDPEPHNASRWTTLQRLEPLDLTKVDAGPLLEQCGQFLLRVAHTPAVEIRRLLVERGEDLSEDLAVGRVAVRFRRRVHPPLGGGFRTDERMLHGSVGHRRKIGNGNVL